MPDERAVPPEAVRILRRLAGENPSHVLELAADLSLSPVDVDRHCFLLRERGYVRLRGRGAYELSSDGRRRLDEIAPAED